MIKPPRDSTLTFRLPQPLKRQAKRRSKSLGITLSQYCVRCLRDKMIENAINTAHVEALSRKN